MECINKDVDHGTVGNSPSWIRLFSTSFLDLFRFWFWNWWHNYWWNSCCFVFSTGHSNYKHPSLEQGWMKCNALKNQWSGRVITSVHAWELQHWRCAWPKSKQTFPNKCHVRLVLNTSNNNNMTINARGLSDGLQSALSVISFPEAEKQGSFVGRDFGSDHIKLEKT